MISNAVVFLTGGFGAARLVARLSVACGGLSPGVPCRSSFFRSTGCGARRGWAGRWLSGGRAAPTDASSFTAGEGWASSCASARPGGAAASAQRSLETGAGPEAPQAGLGESRDTGAGKDRGGQEGADATGQKEDAAQEGAAGKNPCRHEETTELAA
eukprot:GHVT01089476.1.p4 GENE.GHVT01089476.1~~GHVT01089476.1.p4  ORF type:complete len:157 (-),score=40.09 GHVT01089476.1:696-1166(-)